MSTDEQYLETKEEEFNKAIAEMLGLTYEELDDLGHSIEDNEGHDGQIHCKIIRFQKDANRYKDKLIYPLENNQIWISLEDWFILINNQTMDK